MTLILASKSPRRKELLREAGYDFEIVEPDIVEVDGGKPEDIVRENGLRKARAAAASHPNDTILAGDTVVAYGDWILGKPESDGEAAEMLRMLSGTQHTVFSSVVVIHEGVEKVRIAKTSVRFRQLTEEEIVEYVNSGEPMDKAGGYAIQGAAGQFVEDIYGSYSNVVGLPIEVVKELLK